MRLARWLVALPFLGILIGTAFVNQVEPLVFGMPFVLAWIVGWVVVGAAVMALAALRQRIPPEAPPPATSNEAMVDSSSGRVIAFRTRSKRKPNPKPKAPI